MRIFHKSENITDLVTTITWSGDYQQVARTLDFGIASDPNDPNLPQIKIEMGDLIRMRDDDGGEWFKGFVFSKDKSISGDEIQILAYDGLIYLTKSKGTYNFKDMTPGGITRKVCQDFGIDIGEVIEGSNVSRIFDSQSIYDIIQTVYTLESQKTKKKYMPKMIGSELNIIEKGKKVAKYQLDNNTSIIDASYGENIEDSINRVKIYDETGEYKGQVSLDGVPGILQDTYTAEEGVDEKQAAESLLKGIEKTAEIEVLGDFDLVTGNAVRVKEPYTGLVGLFYIDNDQHEFSEGQHMTRLGLAFENIMDTKLSGDDPAEIARREAEAAAGGGGGGGGGGGIIGSGMGSTVVRNAERALGTRYVWAGNSPTGGIDCSGLVDWAYTTSGYPVPGRLTSAGIRSNPGRYGFREIPYSSRQVGDVLWTSGHVALQHSGSNVIEAVPPRVVIQSGRGRFSRAYRYVGV